MLDAARAEAAKPSTENLPASGELVRRDVTDAREIRWHGRESFIKQMSRGGQKVLRIINPKTGAISYTASRCRRRGERRWTSSATITRCG